MTFRIGIDVGGTTTTIAVGNNQREVLMVSEQFESRTSDGPDATLSAIMDQITTALGDLGGSPRQIVNVGLATPGPATIDGVLRHSPNLDETLWDDFPFRASLEQRVQRFSSDAKVRYIGDGQAAAFGEYSARTGAVRWGRIQVEPAEARPLSSLFMLIVGTGLGGGEVEGGQVVRGKKGRAGHAGHILLPEFAFRYRHDRELLVGNATCSAESAISLTGLTHQLAYRLTLDEWKDHPLQKVAGTMKDRAKKLRGLAADGDALALQLFADQARALGITLLDVNYVGDFDLLVVGGGVCDLSESVRRMYLETAAKTYHEYALDGFRDLDCLEFSVCGDEAPVIGALAYAY